METARETCKGRTGRTRAPESTRARPRFGAHMSIAGGHDRAVRAAAAAGCEVFQVFTKSTNQWAAAALTPTHIEAYRKALQEAGLPEPVAHTSYLINLASPDDALWRKSIDSLVVEIERAEVLGIRELVCHPGAHMGAGEEAGCARVAEALRSALERTTGTAVRVDLESTAGQGTCLGHRFEHLGAILEAAGGGERLGVCLDSCHLFAAGYQFNTEEQYNEMIDALDRLVGWERVRVWHLNDSVRGPGSRVDRHAGIGRGEIGLESFRWIVNDRRFVARPFILETPKGLERGQELDTINLGLLRGLVGQTAAARAEPAARVRRRRATS